MLLEIIFLFSVIEKFIQYQTLFSATFHIKHLAFAEIKQEHIYSLGPDSLLHPLSVLRAFPVILWRTKHVRKRFQNFRQSYMSPTDRIEIHQSQPLV